jgi:L-lactate dehydrogenase complex protein LldG
MNSSRDAILDKIRAATHVPSDLPEEPIGTDRQIADGLAQITQTNYAGFRDQFKKELEAVSGEFVLAANERDIVDAIIKILCEKQYVSLAIAGDGICTQVANQIREKMPNLELIKASDLEYSQRKQKLAVVPAALVEVTFAVADVATLALLNDDTASTIPHFLPECIFTIVKPEQMVANIFELFSKIPPEKAKNMTLITGPSRTADVEKILVLGAHGPGRLVVFMLENDKSRI